tara:strand:+ start:2175 stop:2924 length:750 start_codon:yes stop_codon:yes gene_type:complete
MSELGCCRISNFIRSETVIQMAEEARSLHEKTFWSTLEQNPYASEDDETFPKGHPRRFFSLRSNGFICSDLLPANSLLNQLYASDVLTHFVWECLEVDRPLYRYADPLASHPYSVMEPESEFPWHFDGNEFTISVLVQQADLGGIFEYVPDIRSPGQENYEKVEAILHGGEEGVRRLDLNPGDLQLFKGRYSMHRVTKIEGATTRYIALPSYVYDPYRMNQPHHSINYYGRATEAHYERSKVLVDGLTD